MRIKYQLRGLGIGLIITTIILTISHNVREIEANSKSNMQPTESTGSILAFDKNASSKADNENSTESGSQSENESQTEQQESQTEQQTEKQTERQTEKQTEKPTEKPTGNVVTVNIKNVYYARQAADILYDAGVITDKQDFVNYLDKAGYAERISEGTYQIRQGDSYETIAKTICRIK